MKKNTKYTKEQRDAVDGLTYALDELDNKPRRLYQSIREFAHAFIKKDGKYLAAIVSRIDQAEKTWYSQWGMERNFADILYGIRQGANDLTSSIAEEKFKREEKSCRDGMTDEEVDSRWYAYERGIEKASKMANVVIIRNNYPESDNRFN